MLRTVKLQASITGPFPLEPSADISSQPTTGAPIWLLLSRSPFPEFESRSPVPEFWNITQRRLKLDRKVMMKITFLTIRAQYGEPSPNKKRAPIVLPNARTDPPKFPNPLRDTQIALVVSFWQGQSLISKRNHRGRLTLELLKERRHVCMLTNDGFLAKSGAPPKLVSVPFQLVLAFLQ